MPTRFYLPASGVSPLNTLAVDATWEGSASTFFRAPAPLVKTNTALANFAARMGSTGTRQDCWGQWTSDPLSDPFLFTNAHTISMCVRGLEGNAACDAHLAYVISVVNGAGTVDRGVIATFMATATELGTSAATRIHTARVFTGGDVQAYAGDRIVIELGTHGVTPSIDYDVTWRFGDPTASGDFPLTSALTTDVCPWVEISPDIAFASATHAASKYPTVTSTSNATAPYDDDDWVSAANVKLADLTFASITATTYDANDYSYLLKSQHFDFAVPSTATITGLEVRTKAAVYAATADWAIVQLLNASGTAEGDNNAADGPATMYITNTVTRFGSPTDMWGVALTPAMVNDDDFGVQFSIKATGADTDIRVDYVKITVYYTDAPVAAGAATVTVTGAGSPTYRLTETGAAGLAVTGAGTAVWHYGSALTSLTKGTTYHVRAYATNSVGTAYGAEVDFETPDPIKTEAGAATLVVTGAGTINVVHQVLSAAGAATLAVTGEATAALVHYEATEAGAAALAITGAATTKRILVEAGTGAVAVTGAGTAKCILPEAGAATLVVTGAGTIGQIENVVAAEGAATLAVTGSGTIELVQYEAAAEGAATLVVTGAAATQLVLPEAGPATVTVTAEGAVAEEVAAAGGATLTVTAEGAVAGEVAAVGAATLTVTAAGAEEATLVEAGDAGFAIDGLAIAATAGDEALAGDATLAITGAGTIGVVQVEAGAATLAVSGSATIGQIENVVAAAGAAAIAVTGSGAVNVVHQVLTAAGAATVVVTGSAAAAVTHQTVTEAGAAGLAVTGSATIGLTHYVATVTGAATVAFAGTGSLSSTRTQAGAATVTVTGAATVGVPVALPVAGAATVRFTGAATIRAWAVNLDITAAVRERGWSAAVTSSTWAGHVHGQGWDAATDDDGWSMHTEGPGWVATMRRTI